LVEEGAAVEVADGTTGAVAGELSGVSSPAIQSSLSGLWEGCDAGVASSCSSAAAAAGDESGMAWYVAWPAPELLEPEAEALVEDTTCAGCDGGDEYDQPLPLPLPAPGEVTPTDVPTAARFAFACKQTAWLYKLLIDR
jgi:hypothetical protein